LEAPDDIQCVQFNPKYPNLVAGGCVNGQVIVWDLKDYEKHLQTDKKSSVLDSKPTGGKKNNEVPIVKWTWATPVEYSHRASVMDLHWLETSVDSANLQMLFTQYQESGNLDPALASMDPTFMQLVTCSIDGFVAFWDTRLRSIQDYRSNARNGGALGKSFLRLPISSADGSIEYSLIKISLRKLLPEEKKAQSQPANTVQPPKKVNSKLLSKFFCGSEVDFSINLLFL
jgi:WD40 repeat protein